MLKKLEVGKVKLHELEQLTNDAGEAARLRRAYLEMRFKSRLQHVGSSTMDMSDALGRNIENPIGAVQVPLGYAGDLRVNGENAKGTYPIILATTEGRLVAGLSRGINVANAAGGVNVAVTNDGMTRDVLVRVSNVKEAKKLVSWVRSDDGFGVVRVAFSKSTKHGKLVEVRPYAVGRDVHLRFKATTGAAMGMNMLTIAAKASAEAIVSKSGPLGIHASILSESGNMCSDKKPAQINMIEGRGVSLVADMTIPRNIVLEKFRAEPERIADLNKAKNLIGSAAAGSHGFNAHVANTLAGMYIAFGQDPAQVVEGAQAITDVGTINDDLYISCTLPSIEVGTYGGGTARETQKELLKLIGLYGEKDTDGRTRLAFAEVIAAACLVSEANVLAIQAAGELSNTHGKVKRG